MALINIEYGSLASSDTMNKNFSYLENKIAETSGSINTSISSLLSNIATINSRLSDISEDVLNFSKVLENYKVKIKNFLTNSSMIPDWSICYSVTFPYKAITNGYLLILPKPDSKGEIHVNNKVIQAKLRASVYDNGAQTICIPLKSGDKVDVTITDEVSYFIPVLNINFDDETEELN